MHMANPVTYQYVCPVCEETIEVNEGMREALLEHGCVLCGSDVSTEAFAKI